MLSALHIPGKPVRNVVTNYNLYKCGDELDISEIGNEENAWGHYKISLIHDTKENGI